MTLGEHLRRTLALALPVMVARAGLIVLVAVDTAMTGYAGAGELATYGLALVPQLPMILIGVGLLMGTNVLSAQAAGAGELRRCGAIWRVALMHAAAFGLILMAASYLGHPLFLMAGQAPDLARGGAAVLVMLGWSLPAVLLYVATTFYLEGIGRPLPGMAVMLGANLANALLNWVFIYGHLGAPAMGAEGAALATTIVRGLMFLALGGYVLVALDARRHGIVGPIAGLMALGRRLRGIGFPLALSHGMESSAFSSLLLFAGLIGATELAAFQVALNLISFAFMCAVGIATAAGVRVANAVGRRDRPGMWVAGWVAVGLAGATMLGFAALFAGAPGYLAGFYTDDGAVLGVAVPTVALMALILIPDGAQGVLMGCLRGAADVWAPAAIYLIAFWGVQMPLGYTLAVARGGGTPGLVIGILAGTSLAALLLAARFHRLTRRPVALA